MKLLSIIPENPEESSIYTNEPEPKKDSKESENSNGPEIRNIFLEEAEKVGGIKMHANGQIEDMFELSYLTPEDKERTLGIHA